MRLRAMKTPFASTDQDLPRSGLVHAKGWLNAILSARKVLIDIELTGEFGALAGRQKVRGSDPRLRPANLTRTCGSPRF